MSERNDGGPAFPVTPEYDYEGEHGGRQCITYSGMALRDWLAGQASEDDVLSWLERAASEGRSITRERAKYLYADAMLAERDWEDSDG